MSNANAYSLHLLLLLLAMCEWQIQLQLNMHSLVGSFCMQMLCLSSISDGLILRFNCVKTVGRITYIVLVQT